MRMVLFTLVLLIATHAVRAIDVISAARDNAGKYPPREIILRRLLEQQNLSLTSVKSCLEEKLRYEDPNNINRPNNYQTIADLLALLLANADDGYHSKVETQILLGEHKRGKHWEVQVGFESTYYRSENGANLVGGFVFELEGDNYRYVNGSMQCNPIN